MENFQLATEQLILLNSEDAINYILDNDALVTVIDTISLFTSALS